MNPGRPAAELWANLLGINQTKFCTGGLFLFFPQSGHFDSPLSHFHNYARPFANGVKMLHFSRLHVLFDLSAVLQP